MREIKFRGKKIDSNEWIFGWLRQSGHQEIQKANGQYVRTEKYYQIQNNKYHFEFVTEETIGQYTGLKDKKRKEIYEGDIVKGLFNDPEEPEIIGIVRYDDCKASYMVVSKNGSEWELGCLDELEVIGNIHDNPKLLEVKHE